METETKTKKVAEGAKANTHTKKTSVAKEPKTPKAVKATDFQATIYNQKGVAAGKIALPENVFGLKWSSDLVHQVVTSMMSSQRTPVAHTKNRGDVSGGGKKPWQQKGTGRARHGSTRSPIWIGGGVTHGPRNDKNYDRKVNKKMKAKALYTILSRKFRDGQILFVDDISFKTPKTKDAVAVLSALSKISGYESVLSKKTNSAILAFCKKDVATEKSFHNFGSILTDEVRNLNPIDLLNYKYLIIENPKQSLPLISAKLTADKKITK
jgi:large subunit ribosomal protein L4